MNNVCPFLEELSQPSVSSPPSKYDDLGGYSVDGAFKVLDHLSFVRGLNSAYLKLRAKLNGSDCAGECALSAIYNS